MSLSSTSTWFGTLLILFGVAFGDVRRIVDLEDAEFKLLLPLGRPRLPSRPQVCPLCRPMQARHVTSPRPPPIAESEDVPGEFDCEGLKQQARGGIQGEAACMLKERPGQQILQGGALVVWPTSQNEYLPCKYSVGRTSLENPLHTAG
eukprot:CAMPEP_0171642658 /NCGR_PEP_ID=MMETSP0990-20121206/32124_1 /TAXON_ID=483369 /ORGANISM="non described non described, Strain CCMP2098" /LENGTH=147 /DNA_ID=CAMNT_0012217997 /DNA_START=421 /DNA_END=865 /DNA_ORIENTATION=-